jgi:alpha-amylase/alpha-mannosidase (GH57 family)
MKRYICVHGHFYQPPRENPWLERIELQDSARPYHDWNERITAECYAPNGASRILDSEGRITRIVNNYGQISFDFGPTLLSWLQTEAPETYARILAADRDRQKRFSGHGSAMAQAYSHMIMPLADTRDKETQILWGIADFRSRFGRDPEGMWLPETACDLESLSIMARHGIRFTVLSPYQARRIRPAGDASWQEVELGQIDPTRAYRQALPGGGHMALFFYNAPVSQAVAFENLLADGGRFARRLGEGFRDDRAWPQLMHIATDGESYGHHHRFGDMALAFALDSITSGGAAELTNYGEYLERHPPEWDVEVLEQTSWSCAHGVERWRSDCGCNSGGRPEWNQKWRQPLREALDDLRHRLARLYEREGEKLFADPWRTRDEYIEVVLDRSPATVDAFLARHLTGGRNERADVTALKLLEMQRHAMLMYTSCGWFFDDLSGIETVQVIQYAGRAVQLAEGFGGSAVEAPFLKRLAQAQSNLPELGDGRRIYESAVKPAQLDPVTVGSHFAVSTLFEEYPERATVYCYEAVQEDQNTLTSGATRLSLGKAVIRSLITRESAPIVYAALHMGDHNISGGAREYVSPETYDRLVREARGAFDRMDFSELVGLFAQHFGDHTFSLRTLFRDEQRKHLDRVLAEALAKTEATYVDLYNTHAPVLKFVAGLGLPQPAVFRVAAEQALNHQLLTALRADELDTALVDQLVREARERSVELENEALGYACQKQLERLAEIWREDPTAIEPLEKLSAGVGLTASFPFEVNLWGVQNVFHAVQQDHYHTLADTPDAARWRERFRELGTQLGMAVD